MTTDYHGLKWGVHCHALITGVWHEETCLSADTPSEAGYRTHLHKAVVASSTRVFALAHSSINAVALHKVPELEVLAICSSGSELEPGFVR